MVTEEEARMRNPHGIQVDDTSTTLAPRHVRVDYYEDENEADYDDGEEDDDDTTSRPESHARSLEWASRW
jgi:hypothetical protein